MGRQVIPRETTWRDRIRSFAGFVVRFATGVGILLGTCTAVLQAVKEEDEGFRDFAVNVSGEVTAKAILQLQQDDIVIELNLKPELEAALLEALKGEAP